MSKKIDKKEEAAVEEKKFILGNSKVGEGEDNYLSIIMQILAYSPPEGVLVAEMENRFFIAEIIKESKEEIEFQSADQVKYVLGLIESSKFPAVNMEIILFKNKVKELLS